MSKGSAPLTVRWFSPLGLFQDFFFIFYFLKLDYDMPRFRVFRCCFVFALILFRVLWATWICSLVSGINVGEILSCYCFKYLLNLFFFCSSLLLLLIFPSNVCFTLCSCPTHLRGSGLLASQSCFSLLSSWKFLLTHPQAHGIFLQLHPLHRWAHEEHSSFLSWCFWSLAFPFCSLLAFLSLSVHCLSVLGCCLLYPLDSLAAVNSWSDNSNMTALPGSDAALSLHTVLSFSAPCDLFLIARHDVPGERNCCKQAFHDMVRCGEVSVFSELVFPLWPSSYFLVSLAPLLVGQMATASCGLFPYPDPFPIGKMGRCSGIFHNGYFPLPARNVRGRFL